MRTVSYKFNIKFFDVCIENGDLVHLIEQAPEPLCAVGAVNCWRLELGVTVAHALGVNVFEGGHLVEVEGAHVGLVDLVLHLVRRRNVAAFLHELHRHFVLRLRDNVRVQPLRLAFFAQEQTLHHDGRGVHVLDHVRSLLVRPVRLHRGTAVAAACGVASARILFLAHELDEHFRRNC